MGPIRVHSDDDDHRAEMAKHDERICGLIHRVESLEQKLDDLRKWQHTVLGASSVVLFALGSWGGVLLKYVLGLGGGK